MTPEERFAYIESILQAMAERSDLMEARSNERFEKIEKEAAERERRDERRWAQNERRWAKEEMRWKENEKRWKEHSAELDRRRAESDKRAAKFDRQLQATKKLVELGMKLVIQNAKDTRELKKSQKAFLDSFRGGNSNGHHRNGRS